jgi:hypothetical protein
MNYRRVLRGAAKRVPAESSLEEFQAGSHVRITRMQSDQFTQGARYEEHETPHFLGHDPDDASPCGDYVKDMGSAPFSHPRRKLQHKGFRPS